MTDFVYVDEDFRSDLGFIPRTDIFKSGNRIRRNFYSKNGKINRQSINVSSMIFWRPNLDFKKTDHRYLVSWDAEFRNQATWLFSYTNNYIFLTRAFDPTRTTGGTPLPSNTGYTFNQFTTTYQSNLAKVVSFNATSTLGQFYNGHNFSASSILTLRMQPWVLFTLAMNYDGIRLPNPYPDANLWLVSPKIDITFSKSLFWSTLVQYSNQRNNLGLNSRLQWRFAPLSDLYLVYNDNYFTDNFGPRFRSINLKLTYWLNI
jgi:hypothetical protein